MLLAAGANPAATTPVRGGGGGEEKGRHCPTEESGEASGASQASRRGAAQVRGTCKALPRSCAGPGASLCLIWGFFLRAMLGLIVPLGLGPVEGGLAGAPAVQSALCAPLRSPALSHPPPPCIPPHFPPTNSRPLLLAPAGWLDSSACGGLDGPRPRRRPPPRDPGGGPHPER